MLYKKEAPKPTDAEPRDDAAELAKLLYDIFVEEKANVKIIAGQNNANRTIRID